MCILRAPAKLAHDALRGHTVIGIDGDQGSGKTTLARELHAALGGQVVSIDEFLLGNGLPYARQLDAEKLRPLLTPPADGPLVIESVLLLDVLPAFGVVPDYLIFCRRELEGSWEYTQYLRPKAFLPSARLTREIAEYYRRRRPFEQADLQVSLSVSHKCVVNTFGGPR